MYLMKGWVMEMAFEYQKVMQQVNKNIKDSLSFAQEMNSYITTRGDYKVLLDEGVLDPTCITDLQSNLKSINKYLRIQSNELEYLQEKCHRLICCYILKLDDEEMVDLITSLQSKGSELDLHSLTDKAQNEAFTPEEYEILLQKLFRMGAS